MPRFSVLPQRRSAPAAFSNRPRAQAAHFGAGIGRNLANLSSEAAELGQVIEQRQERQVKQQMSQFDLELAKQRAESDMQAPPGEASDARIERHQSIFDTSAEKLLQGYQSQSLQMRLRDDIEGRRETWNRKLLAGAAQQRLGESLQDVRELVEHWAGRVAANANEFPSASLELLGDETSGEPGLLAGLGLRPEDRQKSLLEDAQEAHRRVTSLGQAERTRQGAQKALELSQAIGRGTAGLPDIRQAEEAGALSAPQAEALRVEAQAAETALQARKVVSAEFTASLSSGVGFDLKNPQHREAAESFYETTFRDAVRAGADMATQERIADAVAKTGYIPKALARDLSGRLLGSDEVGRLRAAELYGRLREVAPEQLEDAIDLETRAQGGVLHSLLEMGLPEGDALARAEAEAPSDGIISLDADEVAAVQRALREGFGDGAAGQVSRGLVDQLHERYLRDLAQGVAPRQARERLQKHAASALIRLEGVKAKIAEKGFVLEERNGRLVPVQTEARLHKAEAATLTLMALGTGLLIGAAFVYSVNNAEAMGLDVSDDIKEMRDWVNDQSWEVKETLFFEYPELAPWLGWSVIEIPGDKKYLGKIVIETESKDFRIIEIQFGKNFRRMSALQRRNEASGTYVDETGRYLDWDGNDILIDLKTGLVIPPEERGRYLSPPLEPQSGDVFNPGGFGEGVEVEQLITTGGAPPDNSLLNGQPEVFVPIGDNGPRMTSFPDQSDEPKIPIILLSEGGYRNAKKGDLSADGTFTWWYSGRYTTNKTLRKQHAAHKKLPWPIDPDTGKNQDVSHPNALADGGPDYFEVVKPMTRKDHIEHHMNNGDFKRWRNQRGK